MRKGELKKELEKRLNELSVIEQIAIKELKKLPEGKICARRKGKKCCQYYLKKEKGADWQYLKRSEDKLAIDLIQKEYAEKTLAELKRQKRIIEDFIRRYDEEAVSDVRNKISEPKIDKIKAYTKSDAEFVNAWYKKQEEIKAKESKHMYSIKAGKDIEILTEKGESVRSKSEKIIADKLNMMNVPYCYEVPLFLKGVGYVRPDFKVLNVATRKEYYWEHYGMMDNQEYMNKALKKRNAYINNNFKIGGNLIETFETQNCPLDTRNVEEIIKTFLV